MGISEPPRVTNDLDISVRKQIRIAQFKKGTTNMHTGKAFRQNNKIKTTEDGNDSQDPDENRVQYTGAKQRSISSNGRNLGQTLVFVDGYNIIHKWSILKRQMEQENLGVARSTLIEHLADLRYVEGWTIEVVFDGPEKHHISREVIGHDLVVVYCSSADTYIEERCRDLKNITKGDQNGSLIVATGDNMIRMAAVEYGAVCMSAEHMVNKLKSSKNSVKAKRDLEDKLFEEMQDEIPLQSSFKITRGRKKTIRILVDT